MRKHAMRRLIALSMLFAPFLVSCGTTSSQDIAAAREYVHSIYSNPDITFTVTRVEGPEYATVPKIPRDHIASVSQDRSAACAVRVWFDWRDEHRNAHE